VKFQEAMLASLLRQYEAARLDEAKEGPVLQQVDVAVPPDFKSKPSKALIVLASTLVAFLVSSLVVVWRRYRAMVREQDPQAAAAWARVGNAWRWRRPKA
jgi:tyrosine-protein kinase Etk/Wzc